MRHTSLALAVLAVLVPPAAPAGAGNGVWTTGYPYGGSFGSSALAIDPANSARLYAHPNWRGLYESDDGGATWQPLFDESPAPFDDKHLSFVVVDPGGDLLAGAFDFNAGRQALWRSPDGGATWEPGDPGVSDHVSTLAIAPSDAGERYLGTENGQLWRSSDGGATWTLAAAGGALPLDVVRTLEIDPGDPLVAFLGTHANGLYKTTDGGSTWANVNANVVLTEVVDVAIDPVDPQVVYAADADPGTGKGIFKSTDGGASWVKLGPFMEFGGAAGRLIAIEPGDPLHLFAVAGAEILESPDGGASWSAALTADGQLSSVQFHPTSPSALLATSFSEGIFRSTDGGATWHPRHTGIRGLSFSHLAAHGLVFAAGAPARVYAATLERGYRSGDAGVTWSPMAHPGGVPRAFATHPAEPASAYALAGDPWRSVDGGATWASLCDGTVCGFAGGDLAVDPTSSQTVYLAGFGSATAADGVYVTSNAGSTWDQTAGQPASPRIGALAVDPNDPNVIYAGTAGGPGPVHGLFRSPDGGVTWPQLTTDLPADLHPNQIVVHPLDSNRVFVAAFASGQAPAGDPGLFRSTNGGSNWAEVIDDNLFAVAVDPGNPAKVYAAGWGAAGVYRSLDGGDTWALVNAGLPPNVVVQSVAVDPADTDRMLLGTAAGVYEHTFAGTVELTVTHGGDAGPGSLRDALEQANQDGLPNVITFEPWLAGATIGLASPLPPLSEGGTSVDGDLDGDCVPDIGVNGNATCCDGITITSAGNRVRGLVINGFPGNGVLLEGGATDNEVECNFIGTDASGTASAGNAFGIHLRNGATGNRIGGDPATQGNVVSGNFGPGFHLLNAQGNTIAGNRIGVAAQGATPLGNNGDGVYLESGSSGNVFGPANVIAHNGGRGVSLVDGLDFQYPDFTGLSPDFTGVFPVIDFTDDCGVFHSADAITPTDGSGAPFSEHLGMRLTGTLDLGANGDYTFELPNLDDQARIVVDAVVILDACCGGPTPSATVGLSMGPHTFEVDYLEGGGFARLELSITGVGSASLTTDGNLGGCPPGQVGLCGELFQLRIPSEGNRITANSIFDNGGLGIAFNCCCGPTPNDPGDLDVGPNTALNHPEITGVTDLGGGFTVNGTAPPDSTVEVFSAAPDPSGFGEGEVLLTSTVADGGGSFSATVTLPPGAFAVTATATDAAGNTSEFSPLSPLGAHVLTVTETSDDGPGSLRDAIEAANSDGAPTAIGFAPSLADRTIALQSPLPPLTADDTTIDGDLDGDCRPDVALDGSAAGGTGLEVRSSRNRIRGLALHGFSLYGVHLDGSGGPAADNVVECNHVGTDLEGLLARGNSPAGVAVSGGASGNRVGPGNRIVANAFTGVELTASHGNQVVGNTLGLDAAGDPLPNPVGVGIGAGATGNRVGGAGADGNRIVATSGGIELADGGTSGNQVLGNTIGWPDGTVPQAPVPASVAAAAEPRATPAGDGADPLVEELPVALARELVRERWQDRAAAAAEERNAARELVGDEAVPQGFGIRVTAGAAGNQIGDPAPGLGNEISNNGGTGVRLDGGDGADGNAVRGNSIHGNGGLGIDLGGDGVTANDAGDVDAGPNDGMNFPVLTRAVTDGATTTIEGQLDTADPAGATVDLYANTIADPSGFGEGETWLASAAPDAGGAFSLTVPAVPAGSWVTATATDGAGDTSELSAALRVQGPTAPAAALLATAQSPSAVLLGWTDPNAGETGFRIERSFDGAGWGALDTVGANATAYLDSTLGPATLVYYRVVAFSAAGDAAPSNVAAAVTFAGSAAKVCRRQVGNWHGGGRFGPSVAWNGTSWAAAWEEKRDGRQSEIYFQLLNADGSPAGVPLQVTEDDMPSQLPTLRWNGSSFALLYLGHTRGPDGDIRSITKMSELDGAGNFLRRDAVVLAEPNTSGTLSSNVEDALEWNGADWGWFHNFNGPAPGDLQYTRIGASGDVLAGPVALTATPDALESDVSAAWSGTEYGVSWIRRQGSESRVFFQRVQVDGTPVGAPLELWQNASGQGNYYTDTLWDGTGWAVAWMDIPADGSEVIHLARLDASGAVVAGPNRISDDFDPAFPPEEQVPVFDEIPDLFVKPGGGYVIFTSSFLSASGVYEVARLEADAAGDRIGGRTVVSPDDGIQSWYNRAAAGGSDFLVAWQEGAQVADAVVDAAGTVLSGPGTLSVFQSPGGTGFQSARVAPLGEGFAALWVEDGQLFAELNDGAGGTSAQRFPLSPTTDVGNPGLVGLGDTFAVAWKELGTNSLRFARYDAAGNPLFGEVTVASPAGGASAALDFSGEVYGIAWAQGGRVRFQKVAPDGTLLGPRVSLGSDVQWPGPVVAWVGSGWALAWRAGGNLFFARLDASGAVAAGPVQLTFGGRARNDYRMSWTGELLGLSWSEVRDPLFGAVLLFTVLDRDGAKAFPEETVVANQVFSDTDPALYWRDDRFHLVHVSGSLTASGVREIEILPDGTVLPGSRRLDNHSGPPAAAWNGATVGLLHHHRGDMLFETTACLEDASPPDPPFLSGGFDGQKVALSWSASGDPESGILGYNLYRDGELLAEEGPGILGFDDFGAAPDTLYRYDLRALNGAFLESPADPASTLFVATGAAADLSVVVADDPDPVLAGNSMTYTVTVTNHGPDAADGVTLTDTLPAGVTLVATAPGPPACTEAGGVVTCGLGALTNGQSTTVTIEVTVDPTAAGTLTSTAAVDAAQLDPVPSNDQVSETTTAETALPGATALVATGLSASSIRLSWQDPDGGELGFRLERSLDGASFTPFHSVAADVTSFTDAGRPAATLHYYRAVAFDALGDAAPSNVAAATTFPAVAAKVCRQPLGRSPEWARTASVAHDGTGWAAAWEDRGGGAEGEIVFQRLDAGGAPVGVPVQVTANDMASRTPKLLWNGTHFGLVWTEHMRTAEGSPVGDLFFALLAADGTKVRGDVRVYSHDQGAYLTNAFEPGAFLWDGSGWGIVTIEGIAPPSELVFYRLDPDGDPVAGPVQVTATPDWEFDPSLAWNGGEYGLSWIRQRDDDYQVLFQRLQADGTPLGTPTLVWDNPSNQGTIVTSAAWDGTGWAVAFSDVLADGSEAVLLARLDAAGILLGPPQRISDDFDPAFPGEERPVFDELPQVVNRPGGGYLIFTSSFLDGSGVYEIARLSADAAGTRTGSRAILSDDDGLHSAWNRVATDGTDFLVAYDERRQGTQEVATVRVDAAGTVVAGPSDLTAGHDPGTGIVPTGPGAGTTVPVEAGFAAVWIDGSATGAPLLQAQVFNGAGATAATRFPLSTRDVFGSPVAVGVGDGFAVAWKDVATNDLLFDRYDSAGLSLLGGEVTVSATASHRGVGMDFSGEAFGLVWFDGNQMTLRRVAPDGTLLGSPRAIPGTGVGPAPQVRWVGSGWALVWRKNEDGHLYYALVDGDGDVLVPPVQVTFTATRPSNHRLLWTGEHLGLLWQENRGAAPPGPQIFFTVLGLDGFKAFPEVVVADGFGRADLYWDADRFRVAFRSNGAAGGLREVEVLPDGTVVAGSRLLSDHQGNVAAAGNGATAAVLFDHGPVYFETTACLDDLSPPSAPELTTGFDGTAVQLTWTAAADSESGILGYSLDRDGSLLVELLPTTLAFADGGFTPGATHTYEVRARNGAYLETLSASAQATPCALEVLVTDELVTGAAVFEACRTLTAGPKVTVTSTGELTLRAGRTVVLVDGFTVEAGGSLVVEIDPALDPQ